MGAKQEIVSRKDIVKIIALVISNWYILVLLPLIAFSTSYVYTHRIQDIYAAKCQILLKSEEVYDYQEKLYRGLGFSSKYASYEETASQMRVIKSSNLIEEVLEKISLNVSYFIVGRLKTTEIYDHMPFKVFSDERANVATLTEFTLKILDLKHYQIQYELNGTTHIADYEFGKIIFDDELLFRIEPQPNLSESSLAMLSRIDYKFKIYKTSGLISKYKSNISVKNIDYTSIVEITLEDQIPERAKEVLDTLAKLYVQNTVKSKIVVNDNTVNYIDKQLTEVIEIIQGIEFELEQFKSKKDILNLEREEDNFFNKLIQLESEQGQLKLELKSIQELTNYLLKNDNIETLLPPGVYVSAQDDKLKEQVSQLYSMRSEYSDLRNSGTSNNPRIEIILQRINTLKQDILVSLASTEEALESRQSDLSRQISSFEQRIKSIPKTQREVLNIERKLAVNEDLYSYLLAKRAETVIAKAGLVPETKIIENARSVGVVYPDKMRMNLINLLVGFGVAVFIVVIKSLFFQKITSLGQLQTSTDISILGSIPRKKDFTKTYRILSGSERSDIVQAFRSLRTNLQYFSRGNKCTKVLVTSLMPGEGKTFTSVNLASVMAIAEKKVLIIDFDLHKPRLAKAMELENSMGVSNFLIGDKSIEELIQKTEIPTMDVITSGPVPPNASELILRDELHEIFQFAEQHYDYVFLDTPPISLITDGLILMNEVDVKLFVLNSKTTSKTAIDFIEQLIRDNSIEGAALILNEEKVNRLNYYYSRYGYGGYGYGYGYGYGEHYSEKLNV